jgi:hypothetical protein
MDHRHYDAGRAVDEGLDNPHRVVLTHVIVNTVGQQTYLGPINTFDESLHGVGSAS